MKFCEVMIGAAFFDPETGEWFKKLDESSAECLTGGSEFIGQIDRFAPDEEVE